ncbi:MAG: hypothetical protein J6P40_07255 [Oscillospiraceae bacterium]|nr:hypothetical protein [Oscillospiraceae bacterium]
MEKIIEEFEHLLNAAKGNYQDFVDLTVDGGEEILALLKVQPEIVRCKDCIYRGDLFVCRLMGDVKKLKRAMSKEFDNWYCADGRKKNDGCVEYGKNPEGI